VLRGMVHAALRAIGSTLDGMVLMCLAPSSSSSSSSSSARSLACAPLAAVLAAVDEAAQRGRGPGEGVCLVRRRHGRGRRVDSCFKGARFCWCVIMSCHHVVSSCRVILSRSSWRTGAGKSSAKSSTSRRVLLLCRSHAGYLCLPNAAATATYRPRTPQHAVDSDQAP